MGKFRALEPDEATQPGDHCRLRSTGRTLPVTVISNTEAIGMLPAELRKKWPNYEFVTSRPPLQTPIFYENILSVEILSELVEKVAPRAPFDLGFTTLRNRGRIYPMDGKPSLSTHQDRGKNMTFTSLFRCKGLGDGCKTLPELAEKLEAVVLRIREMDSSGISLDGVVQDDYAELVTADEAAAQKYGLADCEADHEEHLAEDDEEEEFQ